MDVMALRRILMMGGESMLPKLIYRKTLTMETTATGDNPLNVQLPIKSNIMIVVVIDTIPSPLSSGYVALSASLNCVNNTKASVGLAMRSNGTIGTDTNQCKYDTSTGVMSLGGPYGSFVQGNVYHVYAFDIG